MDARDKDLSDSGSESWNYSGNERQCIEQIEGEPDFDVQLVSEKEQAVQRLWHVFQSAAMACAQLYKGYFPFYLLIYHSGVFGVDLCACLSLVKPT